MDNGGGGEQEASQNYAEEQLIDFAQRMVGNANFPFVPKWQNYDDVIRDKNQYFSALENGHEFHENLPCKIAVFLGIFSSGFGMLASISGDLMEGGAVVMYIGFAGRQAVAGCPVRQAV